MKNQIQETQISNCEITAGIVSKICLRCSYGFVLKHDSTCSTECDVGYYKLGRDCVLVCAYGVQDRSCSILDDCNYLDTLFNPSCQSSDNSCSAEYGNQCFQCKNDILYQSRCIDQQSIDSMNVYINSEIAFDFPEGRGPNGCILQYFNQDGVCVKECSPGYMPAQYQANNCQRCSKLYFYDNQQLCNDNISQGQSPGCVRINPKTTNCMQCMQGYSLINNQYCQLDETQVENCTQFQIEASQCSICQEKYFKQQNQGSTPMLNRILLQDTQSITCVKQCSPSFYLDYNDLTCKKEQGTGLAACEKRSGYQCLKCQQKYKLSCGQCVLCEGEGQICPTTATILPINGYLNNDNQSLTCRDGFILISNQCLANCPLGYYNQNNTCQECLDQCHSCKNGDACLTFKDTSKQCQDMFFFNVDACYPCSPGCLTCSGPENNQCLSCLDGLVLNGNKCSYPTSCPDSQFLSTEFQCLPCNSDCQSCKYFEGYCLTCKDSYFIMRNTQIGGVNYCVDTCNQAPIGRVLAAVVDATQKYCEDAYKNNCLIPQNVEQRCQQCDFGLVVDGNGECSTYCFRYPLLDTSTNVCVQSCLPNTYLDYTNPNMPKCLPSCPPNTTQDDANSMCCDQICQSCQKGFKSQCLSCLSPTVLKDSTCVDSCGDYYVDNFGICLKCSTPQCIKCNLINLNLCEVCEEGYFLKEGTCVLTCGDGWYGDSSQCTPCVEPCQICDKNSCIQCPTGQSTFSNPLKCEICSVNIPNCLQCSKQNCDVCENTYFLNPTSLQCEQCALENCAECSSASQCKTCISSAFYVDSSYNCQSCITNCDICTDNQSCSQCKLGYEYVKILNTCESLCKGNQFRNKLGLCQDCTQFCNQCTSQSDCSLCQNGYEFVSVITKCDALCQLDYFRNDQGICQACNLLNCSTCQTLTTCKTCYPNFTLDKNQQCISIPLSCPDGQFLDVNQTNICQPCSPNCQKCIDSSICLQCFKGLDPSSQFFLNPQSKVPIRFLRELKAVTPPDATCTSACPPEMRPDYTNSICCHPTCLTCSGFQLSQCLSCPPQYALQPDTNECKIICNPGEYVKDSVINAVRILQDGYNSLIQTCQKCNDECETCLDGSSCLTCKSGYLFENNQCVQQCTSTLYKLDSSQGKICCDLSCDSCFNSLPTGCLVCQNETYSVNRNSKLCEFDQVKADKLKGNNDNLSDESISKIPQKYCHWSCKTCLSFEYDTCQTCISKDRIFYRGTCSCPPGTEDLGAECAPSEKQGNEAFMTLNYIVLVSFFGFVLCGKYPLFSINSLFISQFAGYFIYFQEPANVYNKDYIYKAFNIDNLASFFPNPFLSSFLTNVDPRYDQEYLEVDEQIPSDFRFILNEKSQNFLYNIMPIVILFSVFGILFMIVRFTKDPSTKSDSRVAAILSSVVQKMRVSLQWNILLLLMIFSYQEVIIYIALQFENINTSNAFNVFGMLFSFLGVAYAIFVPGIIYYGINHANFDRHTKYGILFMNCINENTFTGKNQILIMLGFKIAYSAIFISAKDKGSAILLLLLIYGIYRILEIVLNIRTTNRSKMYLAINFAISILIFILAAHAYSLSKYRDANLSKFYDYDFAQQQIRSILVFIFSVKVLIMICEMVGLIFFFNRFQAIYSKDSQLYSPSLNQKAKLSNTFERKISNQPLNQPIPPPNLSDQKLKAINENTNYQKFLNPLNSSTQIQNSLEITQSPSPFLLTDAKSYSNI